MITDFNIKIPANIFIKVEDSSIKIKGDLGELNLFKNKQFSCIITPETNILECSILYQNSIKKQKVFLNKEFSKFRTDFHTSLKGVSKGFFTELKLLGVGFRFISYKSNVLLMKIGFCNNASFIVPEGISVFLESPTQISLFSANYSLLKQTAASLRAFRPPDSYKGKGLRYLNETLVLKEIKKNG